MALFALQADDIVPVDETRFAAKGLTERSDLQRLLRDRIEVVVRDAMVLAEEFDSWDESRRRIDLLGLDEDARLVVVELKRQAEGGLMELQALRYAAMVSTMTFTQAVEAHAAYRQRRGLEGDAQETILEFLGWDEPSEEDFGQDVRLVLVAPEFSKELTSTVLWLNSHDLDVRCVRVKPYSWKGSVLVDVQQVIPLPEAGEYQVMVREKVRKERQQRRRGRDLTKYDVTVGEQTYRRLPKRQTVFSIVRYLCGQGVAPEKIQEVLHWRNPRRLWRAVDGEIGSAEFVREAKAAAEAAGLPFNRPRWFCGQDELIVHGGRTYAFSKMWGVETERAIKALLDAFPGHDITVREHEDGTRQET